MSKLSKEQLLLLNNLMYLKETKPLKSIDKFNGLTVGEIFEYIDTSKLDLNKDYDAYITGGDWKKIIDTIKDDEQLMNMKIVTTYVDEDGGGGISAVFVDPETKEAVVAFRGSGENEWKDNFVAGGKTDAADGVSTECQENALEWYRSLDLEEYYVTITGHSKGGNKAKYITVRDNTVDRCVSYDGQGFSDDFMEEYEKEIAYNQDKIENHNVESDYVNIILNDIGTKKYYEGYNYGEGGFAENHGPSTYFNFGGDELIHEVDQDKNMIVVDEFLNSYLRTLTDEEKQKTLSIVGTLMEEGLKGAELEQLMDIILESDNIDSIANITAYTIRYQHVNPELIEALKKVLDDSGLSNMNDLLDTVVETMDWEYFSLAMGVAGVVANNLPDSILEKLKDCLKEKTGVTLPRDELEKLLSIVGKVSEDMGDVELNKDGKDLEVSSKQGYRETLFTVDVSKFEEVEKQFADYSSQLTKMEEELEEIYKNLDSIYVISKLAFKKGRQILSCQTKRFADLEEVLKNIRINYAKSEQRNYSNVV